MPEAKRIMGRTPYASDGDFCRIFYEETDSLYRLSFLLTADCEKAEQCFVSGLEDSLKGNRVFKEWARSWARRAIIRDAARIINPRPTEENTASSFNSSGRTLVAEQVEIAAVLDLAPFERFVFVISVLEHYSEHECSVLLGCSRRDVIAARIRALQQIGSAIELHVNQQVNVGSGKPGLHNNCRSVHELQLAPRLATSVFSNFGVNQNALSGRG
jgi:DNA-directed RNA polymerase specialized sigma24 family protein